LTNLTKLHLHSNKLTQICQLEPLVNLAHLDLCNNNITQISGLHTMTHLIELGLSENNLTKISNLDHLINLQYLHLCNNHITEISGLDRLVKLRHLRLRNNQIKKIQGLDTLINLRCLFLCHNALTKIEGLDHLTCLEWLFLNQNKIRKIEGLENLRSLQHLLLGQNRITKLEGIRTLSNLIQISVDKNPIKSIMDPNEVIFCPHLDEICTGFISSEPIHPIIIRFLKKNCLQGTRIKVFDDNQNVHNSDINFSITNSIMKLMKDNLFVAINKDEILSDLILTERTKRLIFEFMSMTDVHSTLYVTFAELFQVVWKIIQSHPDRNTIKQIMNDEMSDSQCKCFTGRMSRLVNVLNGFDPRVNIKISETDSISNIIILQRRIHGDNIQALREGARTELTWRGFKEDVIEEWISYIE
jgi:hypothetical protein